jgi:bifunctional UDP-N-acetylglucosamine pyrophosphorylase/glucosamine-1-phosphate N-acetyltransferase
VRRDGDGRIQAIVEAAEAKAADGRLDEFNVGLYAFRCEVLWDRLAGLPRSTTGEYYLTDLVGLLAAEGLAVGEISLQDPEEAIGVNTREHLAEAEAALRRRTNQRWMREGVTLIDPQTAYIGPMAELGRDVVIEPNTHVEGKTVVGAGSRLGPNSIIRDSRIGRMCSVVASVVEESEVEDEVQIGPFSHLRPGARIGEGSHIGNFAEVKNSRFGRGVRMGHFSYVGDASVGAQANIGAGTITCNFDGEKKHPTEIGAGAFIGSDTMLVAPVRVGERARTGAGSVVTRDVPDDSTAVGIPARVIRRKAGAHG